MAPHQLCRFFPAISFHPPLPVADLILSTFGHASAYLFTTTAASDVVTLGTIFSRDTPKPIVILYLNRASNMMVASTTQFFKPLFANCVVYTIFSCFDFSRAIILDSLPSVSYQMGRLKENTLVWVGTKSTSVKNAKIEEVEVGEVIKGIAGAFLIMAEMTCRACYVFIGVMQDYSVGKDTLKTFGVLSELIACLEVVNNGIHIKSIINTVNNELTSHSFT
eukprot:TRINITY_DN787_c0_g1_i13.p1 TRINITY_DN787_c0_g1~~TRINITY_DN787_c0_g1_i13.p1  ORF type:complete len:253 (-),score=46.83 TRINITY_DN787_c0_g1_i13:132-794(-)